MTDRLRRLDALFAERVGKKGPRPMSRMEWVAFFWHRVDRRDADDCWLWDGGKYPNGYGRVYCCGEWLRAHRVSAELSGLPVTDDVKVLHDCDNPSCCNPAHLKIGDELQNFRDCLNRRRHPKQKLTFAQVNACRRAKKAGILRTKDLAARFGVNRSTIQRAANGDSYGWL